MDIKPIETIYNGYKFRSRLEARWAVFFDTLGIKYEYEPEGFELSDGTKYLPDFYLPEQNFYIEVKPHDKKRFKELEKCIKLCEEDASKRVIVLPNIPPHNEETSLYWFPCMHYDGLYQETRVSPVCFIPDESAEGMIRFDICYAARNIIGISEIKFRLSMNTMNFGLSIPFIADGYINDIDLAKSDYTLYGSYWSKAFSEEMRGIILKRAYDKARQARFEFKEDK